LWQGAYILAGTAVLVIVPSPHGGSAGRERDFNSRYTLQWTGLQKGASLVIKLAMSAFYEHAPLCDRKDEASIVVGGHKSLRRAW
jgi:hypothetical protein